VAGIPICCDLLLIVQPEPVRATRRLSTGSTSSLAVFGLNMPVAERRWGFTSAAADRRRSIADGVSICQLVRYNTRMSMKALILAVGVAYGIHVPNALSDDLAKKAESCVRCHSVDNAHGGPQLDGLPADYLLRQFESYKSGKRFGPIMQAQMNALTIQDLQDIATYYSSRRPTRASTKIAVDQPQAQVGMTIANDLKCAGCHGQDYRGTQNVPRLAGQLRNYLVLAIMRLQRDVSLHPPMTSGGELIPPPSVEALASYLASLEP